MAVKKSKPEAASKPSPKKKAAGKKPAALKAKATSKSTAAVASDTASKAETPKPVAEAKAPASAKKAAAPKKAAAAPIKLNTRQLDFLKQIQGAKEDGYLLAKKAEQRTIDALQDRKLIKKGAKDKTSGQFRYVISKAGEKHLATIPPA